MTTYYRDGSVHLAHEAVAHLGAGQPERVAAADLQSVHVAVGTGA